MYVKKLASIVLSAVLAATTLASCGGRWDYSQEAAKAVNEAQGENLRVEFQVDQRFTDALHTAVNKNVQPEDVENAMLGDKDIQEMLHSGYRLDVYALRADADAEETARKIAEDYILSRLSGCKKEGYISMVKADNNYFYLAALTYKSSSGGGGGSSGPDKPEEPEKPAVYNVYANYNGALGAVDAPKNVEEGGEVTFTVTPNEDVKVNSITVKVNGGEQTFTYDAAAPVYTVSGVKSDVVIHVEFELEESNVYQVYANYEGELGTVTLSAEQVEEGGEVTFTVAPNDHVKVNSITAEVAGEEEPRTYEYVEDETHAYTVDDVNGDVTITVQFELITYQVDLNVLPEGTNLGTAQVDQTEVVQGGTVKLTVTPKDNTVEAEIEVEGDCTYDEDTLTISEVNEDITITVTFESKIITYDVTTKVNDATLGTVSAPEKVEQGGEFTFTVTPASDNVTIYKIDVTGSCDYDNDRTVSNVQGPVTITVTFAEVDPAERAVKWNNTTKTLTCSVTKDGVTAAEEMESTTLTETAIKTALALQSEQIADDFSLNQVEHLVVVKGSGVTTIGKRQFDSLQTGKKSLQSIDLSGVTKVEGMAFRQCEKLSIVKAEDLKSIDGVFVFQRCTSLKEISLPALEEITDWYAFDGCSSLETVDMPKVQGIPNGTFRSCTSLKSVNLPEAEFVGDYAFAWGYSNGLTSVTLPKVTSLGYGAFSGCYDLFSVDLPAIQSIDYQAFSDCDKLVHIRLGPDLNYLQESTFAWNKSYTIYYGDGEEDFKKAIYDPDNDGVGKIKIYHGREEYETLLKFESLEAALKKVGITDTDTITYKPFSASIPAAPASLSNPVARLILNR